MSTEVDAKMICLAVNLAGSKDVDRIYRESVAEYKKGKLEDYLIGKWLK